MNLTNFKVGDTVKVFTKDPQDNKVHATPFQGVVLALRGEKQNKTFTVQKNASAGVNVERIFPINSPIIEKITVVNKGKVRRAKLTHLRKENR
ncbi:hypothetical protein A3J17_04755 [Candidatus Curtissbacteria bacterium RIFCSPLOWO2_02_FULL_40_11]|uniref:50S ribosomal protein L19 n=2 Tax=Candidatus Curtissiibacteriota TaxID=1752717 RepID=A0A1F5G826_9BACT|nr:MAG: hypothetical protein A3D04_03040 [Candidatus Curtissbacteria bacterium RIFCSPHIGHO2_02_FULL_40_16b]OGD99693.1 MAG: hypothetical protein A3J17_04755 [Candidatus Curtissbacteria bacterium RIFCSPLOWO2_02_FULL_40_11]OGE13679.1 MAG: hypothetical protein A3G14_04885 [Candidatus Curtissbacteria bacterium RIFCSPLOWO2_12_FULL_38_9]